MTKDEEIIIIQATLKDIFQRDVIKSIDVKAANNLFNKWKILTGYIEDDRSPILDYIIDDELDWQTKNQK